MLNELVTGVQNCVKCNLSKNDLWEGFYRLIRTVRKNVIHQNKRDIVNIVKKSIKYTRFKSPFMCQNF